MITALLGRYFHTGVNIVFDVDDRSVTCGLRWSDVRCFAWFECVVALSLLLMVLRW